MTALIFTAWLALPIAPLNPVAEDTLTATNIHISAGVTTPNGVLSTGPEISVKYEMLAVHPMVVRGSIDFKYAKTNPD